LGWVADCGPLLNFIDCFDCAFIRFFGSRTIEEADAKGFLTTLLILSFVRILGVPTYLTASGDLSADLAGAVDSSR
jgi:hypothetical protein